MRIKHHPSWDPKRITKHQKIMAAMHSGHHGTSATWTFSIEVREKRSPGLAHDEGMRRDESELV